MASEEYSNTNAIIMVYDVTCEESFEDLKALIQVVNDEMPHPHRIPILLAGNKLDKADHKTEVVDFGTAEDTARSLSLLLPIECSSKSGENVDQVFRVIATELNKHQHARTLAARLPRPPRSPPYYNRGNKNCTIS